MTALKIQVKVFATADTELDEYVPVFHRWIRENVLPELLIDVVDYTHVVDGPSIALIGHGSDYVLDRGGGRLGVLYANKRDEPPADERVTDALRRALTAARLLEAERGPAHRLDFRTDELLFRVADRLAAPNTDETYERLLPELRAAVERVYGARAVEMRRVGSPKELFTVEVRVPGAPRLSEITAAPS